MQLFEVVQSTPVTFPPDVPASEPLKQLLLGMLEKVGWGVAACGACGHDNPGHGSPWQQPYSHPARALAPCGALAIRPRRTPPKG